MAESLASAAAALMIFLAAFGLGRLAVRPLIPRPSGPFEWLFWGTLSGLIAAGMLITLLGHLGLLYRPLLVTATLAGAALGLWQLVLCCRGCGGVGRKSGDSQRPADWSASRPSKLEWQVPRARRTAHGTLRDTPTVAAALSTKDARATALPVTGGLIAAAGIAAAGAFMAALAPPTAGDALCYHLEIPKVFLREHAILHLPYHHEATYPLLAEVWFLWALAMDGGVAAQLIHWGLGVLLAAATFDLARPLLGQRGGWIAGSLVMLVPAVTTQMAIPLNDVCLATLTTAGLAAWRRASNHDGHPGWFVLTGAMFGGALATKYTALLFVVAAVAAGGLAAVRRPAGLGAKLHGLAVGAVVAASICGVWYVRAAWYRGNPVFPYFASVFDQDVRSPIRDSKRPLSWRPTTLIAAPWELTMRAERYGGRSHSLGALFLAVLPAVAFSRRLRGLGNLLVMAAMYTAGWYALRQNLRFLLPAVPLLAVASGWALMELRRFPAGPRTLAAVAISVCVAIGVFASLWHTRDKLPVAVGLESREEYLLRSEPTFRAARVCHDLLRQDAHLLSQEYRAFYFPCRVTREAVYRLDTAYDRQLSDGQRLADRLSAGGFTHLLLAENETPLGIRYNPTLRKLVDAAWQVDPQQFELLDEYRFRDRDGAVRRYRLLSIR